MRFCHLTNKISNLIPNPAKDKVNVFYAFKDNVSGELNILDAVGQVVVKQNIDGNGSQMQVDISALQSGIYFVKISSLSGFSKNIKLVVSK